MGAERLEFISRDLILKCNIFVYFYYWLVARH